MARRLPGFLRWLQHLNINSALAWGPGNWGDPSLAHWGSVHQELAPPQPLSCPLRYSRSLRGLPEQSEEMKEQNKDLPAWVMCAVWRNALTLLFAKGFLQDHVLSEVEQGFCLPAVVGFISKSQASLPVRNVRGLEFLMCSYVARQNSQSVQRQQETSY